MSRTAGLTGFSLLYTWIAQVRIEENEMFDTTNEEYRRVPGLYRLWDLQHVIHPGDDCRVVYAEITDEGAPLFMVLRRKLTLASPPEHAA